MAKQVIGYSGFDCPDVEVLWNGDWCTGELRQWTQHDDGTWHGNVVFRAPDGTRSQTFEASEIRLDQTDHSRARTV